MNRLSAIFLLYCLALHSSAGEAALTKTFQPLDGLGDGEIHIVEVTCYDWYSHSGFPTGINLISAPNRPPTNAPQPVEDINLASVCGIRFECGSPNADANLKMDATKFAIPKRFDRPGKDILRACLECLRRTLPEKMQKAPLTFSATEKDGAWMKAIVDEFNRHDRSKPFLAVT